MRFVIATRDYSGLGFATRIQEEGHEVILATKALPQDVEEPAHQQAFDRVGCGMVAKEPLEAVMQRRERMRDWYWIWDNNHNVPENETLRQEGFKVLGGGKYAHTMEHDRQACLESAAVYGLQAPPSFRFENCEEAIRFCEQNPHTAYVYKPDEGANFETFLPESEDPVDANQELRIHLASLITESSFILQERKEGVETNVEVWFQKGDPVFAFMAIESKKRHVLDLGELIGCAFDFAFVIPLECAAVQESVAKLYPSYKNMKYTGFGDANFIAARDGIWFFEKCERFGYNAHPNLLYNLARRGTGEILASLMDGNFKPDFAEASAPQSPCPPRRTRLAARQFNFPRS